LNYFFDMCSFKIRVVTLNRQRCGAEEGRQCVVVESVAESHCHCCLIISIVMRKSEYCYSIYCTKYTSTALAARSTSQVARLPPGIDGVSPTSTDRIRTYGSYDHYGIFCRGEANKRRQSDPNEKMMRYYPTKVRVLSAGIHYWFTLR
jgi:hypothetical protein